MHGTVYFFYFASELIYFPCDLGFVYVLYLINGQFTFATNNYPFFLEMIHHKVYMKPKLCQGQ